MIRRLKEIDRILLEMHTGMILFGLLCQIGVLLFSKEKGIHSLSLWFGIILAAASSIHMAKTLDKALPHSENAAKIITGGYIIRYVAVALIFILLSLTGKLNPLLAFLGYMSLKVTAYLQPITHKYYNKLFHETDPVPKAMPEDFSEEEDSREKEELS